MNFNVYLKKDTGLKISQAAKILGRSRNSVITEALEEWLGRHTPSQWPEGFFNFAPIDDVPDFTSLRNDLADIQDEDPLA